MWLHGLNARTATEVRLLLTEQRTSARQPDRYAALKRTLQYLANDLAGRDVTEAECELVWQGGESALDQLISRYEQEHLEHHDWLFSKRHPNP